VAVSAKLLQLVNSAFFGMSREIATVPVAVGYLGFEVLKQLVLTVELFCTFSSEWRTPGFSIEEIQRHSHWVAALASRLAIAPQQTAAVSIAALLHDVGKLILAARLRKPFEQALKVSFEENRPLYLVEEELTGTSHAQIGAYLLGLWGLPPAVVEAVSDHHHSLEPAAGGDLDIGRAVHIADLLANEAEALFKSPPEQGSILRARVDSELRDWKDQLPEWRETAAAIVQGGL
jgi:putative nucleotidyltransferase with HDIG domain